MGGEGGCVPGSRVMTQVIGEGGTRYSTGGTGVDDRWTMVTLTLVMVADDDDDAEVPYTHCKAHARSLRDADGDADDGR